MALLCQILFQDQHVLQIVWILLSCGDWLGVCHIRILFYRVTTCLENLEMSGNSTAVKEMSGILLKVREMCGNCQGKNLVREKLPKTVYCKLRICVHLSLFCVKY